MAFTETHDQTSNAMETERSIDFHCSDQFIPILKHLNAAILISTYRLGKVAVVQSDGERLIVDFKTFEQAMGIAAKPGALAVGTRRSVWYLAGERNQSIPNSVGEETNLAYVARKNHITGNIAIHDLAWHHDELWAVNTLFSCLCTIGDDHNFVPRWKPNFISELLPQDRCHLNGLALGNRGPQVVSVLARTNESEGWRDHKRDGGALIDVDSGSDIAVGLCMPHSPRFYRDSLYFLNSGLGELTKVDSKGQLVTIDRVPGYTRGLSFAGQFAFVGMSQIRETNIFGGLPIGEKPDGLRCGVAVIDMESGRAVAWFEFKNGVEEIFAVEAIPGAYPLHLHSPNLEGDDNELWIIPPLT